MARIPHGFRSDLGPQEASVRYADMAEVGANPARIIPAWRDFVDECQASGRPFVKTIVELAHAVGIRVVAEGVESHAAARFLVDYGCDEGQGFFLGPPRPAEDPLTVSS